MWHSSDSLPTTQALGKGKDSRKRPLGSDYSQLLSTHLLTQSPLSYAYWSGSGERWQSQGFCGAMSGPARLSSTGALGRGRGWGWGREEVWRYQYIFYPWFLFVCGLPEDRCFFWIWSESPLTSRVILPMVDIKYHSRSKLILFHFSIRRFKTFSWYCNNGHNRVSGLFTREMLRINRP